VLPLLVAAVACATAYRDRIVPWGDDALLEAKVREVGHHLVLLGPYSRFQWHHPGPALFYALAAPYRLLGSGSFALNVSALLIAAASIALIGWLVWQRLGVTAVWWTSAVIGLYLWALGPDVLRTPWNPWITILPLLALVMLVWSALGGSFSAYPVAAALGTFLVQSHVGFGALVGVLLVIGGVAVLTYGWRRRRDPFQLRRLLFAVLGTVAVLAVLWAPPVYQQVRDDPGNITELRRFFDETKPDHTLGDGLTATLHEAGALPEQVATLETANTHDDPPGSWAGYVTLVAFVAAAVVALRRRVWPTVQLFGLVVAAATAAAWSTGRIVGPIYDYLELWTSIVGVAAWLGIGFTLLALRNPAGVEPHQEHERDAAPRSLTRSPITALIVVVIAFALINTWSAVSSGAPAPWGPPSVGVLSRELVNTLPDPDEGPVLVRLAGDTWPPAAGVLLQLERDGYSTRVEPDIAWLLGERRALKPDDRPAAVVTIADRAEARKLRRDPEQRQVGAGYGYFAFIER
jgi:hypothetical protein